MSEIPATAEWQLSREELERVERACDRFEAAWRSNERPSLAQYVEDLETPVGKVMFRELLRVELAYRVQHGEQPTAQEYEAIFHGHADLIAAAFDPAAKRPVVEPILKEFSIPSAVTNSPPAFSTQSPTKDATGGEKENWPSIPVTKSQTSWAAAPWASCTRPGSNAQSGTWL